MDPYYPALPKPRSDQMLMIEVPVSSGTDTGRKRALVAAPVEKLGEAGVDRNDIMVFFLETDRARESFGGGQFAPCCLRPINERPSCHHTPNQAYVLRLGENTQRDTG